MVRKVRRERAVWTRRLWMQLAAANAMVAVAVLVGSSTLAPDAAELARLGAQLQFMHSMAAIACATFVNVGAHRARHAPAPFLLGSIIVAGVHYTAATGAPLRTMPLMLGCLALVGGWAILIATAVDIDAGSPS